VAVFKALFRISTKSVNNFVDKTTLDTAKACTGAGFNKLPVPKANYSLNKINDLALTLALHQTYEEIFLNETIVHNRRLMLS
jgi:hypothetical protein